MRSTVPRRLRSNSAPLTSVPPAPSSIEYSHPLANLAARILYLSPLPSPNDLPIYILNSWSFPDAKEVDYDALLPYVLSRLPDNEALISGPGYEVVFFAGGGGNNEVTQRRRSMPGWGWFLQAYQLLTRATRKRLQKLYIVHEKSWIKSFIAVFAAVVSPKFRKKIVYASTLNALAQHLPIQDLLIPPTAYLSDRRKSPTIHAPHASGRRAFGVKEPLPKSKDGLRRLPRVLRETTSFVLLDDNIKKEGLFRVSAHARTVEILREAYDRDQKFIVWSDHSAVLASSHTKPEGGDVRVQEVDQTDGYEIHAAAALIKLWYKELREPIFPRWSYQDLKTHYGRPDIALDPPQLVAMLAMEDEWSPISNKISRQILTMHLLPLLSKVADCSDGNGMSPDNLARIFAPSLFRSADLTAEIKILDIVRRILVAMITHWKNDLAPMLGTNFETYEDSLRMPEAIEDREDPLEEEQTDETSELESQVTGVTLIDNDEESDYEIDGSPPPLPPRPRAQTTLDQSQPVVESPTVETISSDSNRTDSFSSTEAGPVRRKAAPALAPLPRYSTIIFQGEQYYNTVPPEGEDGPVDASTSNALPEYEGPAPLPEEEKASTPRPRTDSTLAESSIQRKPLPIPKNEG